MFGHLDLNFEGDTEFRIYMCSLCHTLGKEYGVMARLFTNYDMSLCLLTVLSHAKESLRIKRNICPALSINKILADELPVLRYAAAITVLLVSEKIKDDIYDENKKYPKKLLRWVEKRKDKAIKVLRGFGFDPKTIEEAFETQRILEKRGETELFNLMEPTAIVMSEIYAGAAILSGISEYESIFKRIGYSLGKIIYLLDCIADYRHDLMRNTFNPLCKCLVCRSDPTTSISHDIKENVFHLLKTFQMDIKKALHKLPENPYLKDIFEIRLTQKLEEMFKAIDLFRSLEKATLIERVRNTLSFLPLFSSGLAFASREKEAGSGCFESLTSILCVLFIIFIAYAIICRGFCRECCSGAPDKVTVNHGCEGKRTYRRDPCTGEYRDDRNRCC